ncbi:MAG: phenylalanine--tRNA ligase subunit alpha [Nanoarchaeota archaeon]
MDINKIITSLSPVERKIFPIFKTETNFEEIVKNSNLDKIEVMRAIQWLENKQLIKINKTDEEVIDLDFNGKKYLKNQLPERRLLNYLELNKLYELDDLLKNANISNEELNITIGILKKRAAIDIIKDDKIKIKLSKNGFLLKEKNFLEEEFLKKDFPIKVSNLKDEDLFCYKELLKRKNIIKKEKKSIREIEILNLGKKLLNSWKNDLKLIEKLTPAVLKSNAWKNMQFRRYDVSINVPKIYGGRKHFVDQAIDYIKRIWLDLGFTEMTGDYVQTAFWDLDALFVPQDHPAREAQDTFYLKNPKIGKIEKKWLDKIKEVHETGGDTGSTGWKNKWQKGIAQENLLRTHTTVLSAKVLSELKKSQVPKKFFSVGRVFRNEALSWKHLFEFIQVEGIVVDYNANFSNLKGYLKEFFGKMGFSDVRIRPAHFPYTEPSAEIDLWHPTKKKWVELGGSGIFRPEVTKPLFGEEIPVLAWGFGMERTIMQYYKFDDIRSLYKNDIKQLREIKLWRQ